MKSFDDMFFNEIFEKYMRVLKKYNSLLERLPFVTTEGDLISRRKVIECLENLSASDDPCMEIGTDDETFIGKYEAIEEISDLPPAQPKRKKGKWKRRIVDNGWNADWVCSECGYIVHYDFVNFNYCPNCGTDMEDK